MRFDFRHNHDLIRLFNRPAGLVCAGVGAPAPVYGASASRARMRHPSLRLLEAVLLLAGKEAELISQAERPWASATFSGTRHTFTLSFKEDTGIAAGEDFIAILPDHEFMISGRLVADAGVNAVTHTPHPHPIMVVEADVLLLDDC